jgi:cytochrome c2
MKWKWITGAIIVSFIIAGGSVLFSQSAAVDQGKEVYTLQKCALCHSIANSSEGVALDGIGARLRPDDMKRRIRAPRDVRAGSEMKEYPNLTERDLNNLIAYLQTLKQQ